MPQHVATTKSARGNRRSRRGVEYSRGGRVAAVGPMSSSDPVCCCPAKMPIRFTCAYCNQKLSVGSRKAGQQALCPKCQRTVKIPAALSEPSARESLRPATDDSPVAGPSADGQSSLKQQDEISTCGLPTPSFGCRVLAHRLAMCSYSHMGVNKTVWAIHCHRGAPKF